MALRVISHDLNDRTGIVIIEADGQEEVLSPNAKKLALETASSKVSRPGISGNETPYPVDAEGNTSEALVLGQAGRASAYRCDYKIQGGL